MIEFANTLNILLMFAMPVVLAAWLVRRMGLPWALVAAGAITFIASQVVHIPLNYGVSRLVGLEFMRPLHPWLTSAWMVPLGLGLSAGLCEETGRYICFRKVLRDRDPWATGLVVGAGHGGIESVFVGGLALLTFLNMLALRNGAFADQMPPEVAALVQAQVYAFWSIPWPAVLAGALERGLSITFHLGCSVMVARAVAQRRLHWLFAAIGAHAAVNAGAVALIPEGGLVVQPAAIIRIEAYVALFAVGMLWLIRRLRPPKTTLEPAGSEVGDLDDTEFTS